jgi:hypothetical protein
MPILTMSLRLRAGRGSHLPMLMKAVSETDGPILELGCGVYSTIFLHWSCWLPKRRLVTYENNPRFFAFLQGHERDYHEVHCVDDWDAIDISEPWSVAFIDHEPGPRRGVELGRLTHAEYVVAHDTEHRNDHKYEYCKNHKLYKYQYEYKATSPHTSIFSNVHDVRNYLG